MTDSQPQETDSAGVVLLPPYMFLGALALSLLFHLLIPWQVLDDNTSRAFGILFLGGGIALVTLAIKGFKAANTPIPPNTPARHLVEDGVYNYCRNPMYVGLFLIYGAIGLIFSIGWIFLFMPALIIYMRLFVIPREEAYLERRFGDVYLAYCRRVGRWF